MTIMQWIDSNKELIGLVIAAIPIVWGILQYLLQKRTELKDARFETYHKVIQRIVESEDPGRSVKLDRQLASIFELRKFPEYYEPSIRIIDGLKLSWASHEGTPLVRIREEMDATLLWMTKKHNRWFRRGFRRLQSI
jgi:hypothetical protein